VGVRRGVCDGVRLGVGPCFGGGVVVRDGEGDRVPGTRVGLPKVVGIACAVGGMGAVESTTNRTVRNTTVTITAVHDSQTRK
jgi:hypothetical protein